MDYVRNLRDRIPVVDRLSLLALVVMIVVGLADILFVTSYIVPRLKERGELVSQLDSAQKALDEALKAREASPDELRKQVEAAQAKLDNVASVFLSDSQATEALNRLYQYAIESEVEITSLQAQAASQEEEKGSYDVMEFRLQAEGTILNLVDFVSLIEEAALESFVISNVNITGDEEQRTLNMDIALYTSPYSSGAAVSPTPGATVAPEDLAQKEVMLAAVWAAEEWEQAIDLIEQILAIEPDRDDMTGKLYSAHVNYGLQFLDEGDPDGAKVQFENALEIRPDGVEALAGLQQAATWVPMPTPVPTAPTMPAPTLTAEEQLAKSLHEPWAAKDWETVIGLIEQILVINPGYADMTEKLYAAHVNYGQQLVAEGKLEEAKTEFTRALDVNPVGGEAMAELEALAAGGATPVPSATPIPGAQPTIHVVKSGENLYRISLRYGTTVQAIMVANGLTSYNIYVGQQLRIPLQ